MNYKCNLLHHVGVVAKKLHAAEMAGPGVKNNIFLHLKKQATVVKVQIHPTKFLII